MKKFAIVITLLLASGAAFSQQPSPDPDTLKNPVKQVDPEVKQPPADIHYVEDMQRIAAEELPRVVLDSLKKAEPASWEKSVIYRHKKEDKYTIEVREGGEERIYSYNKEGKRLEDDEQQEKDDR